MSHLLEYELGTCDVISSPLPWNDIRYDTNIVIFFTAYPIQKLNQFLLANFIRSRNVCLLVGNLIAQTFLLTLLAASLSVTFA